MVSVFYQTLFSKKCDFKKELSSIVAESFEDNYILCDEGDLESALAINYIKELSKDRYNVGFGLQLDEEVIENTEQIVNSVCQKLNDSDRIIVALKFSDSIQFALLNGIYEELYRTEMKLREAVSFVFVDTYNDGYYDLLRDIELTPQFERKSNLRKKEEERRAYLRKRLENEFFHILFPEYCKLTELKPLKERNLFHIAEISADFDEFKGNIVNRGVKKEEYLDFLNSIKEDMESLNDVRVCVAHCRTPSDDELANYQKSLEDLNDKLDNFLLSSSGSS